MDVQIVIDVACAWSYIGLTRYRRFADGLRDEGTAVTTTFAPFQLDPDAPPRPEPLLTVLERKLGRDAVAGTGDVIALARDHDGLDLRYDRAVHSNTFEAHVLIHLAGGQGLGEVTADRLFRAHFTDGLDVADPEVLAALAEELGVARTTAGVETARTAVRAGLAEVRGSGVRTIPVFRRGDGSELVGAVAEEELRDFLSPSPSS